MCGGHLLRGSLGGNGGGAIRLIVTGTLTNHGTISANGGDGGLTGPPSPDAYAVGGSGGSIWATVGTLTGSGAFTADGGLRYWGGQPVSGGGGGRVAVYYAVNNSFTGFNTSSADGGLGAEQGTAIFINTTGNDLEITGGQTFVIPQDSSLTFANVTVHNGASLIMGGGATLYATGTLLVSGNSQIIVQGKNTAWLINGQWQGHGVTITAANVQVDAGSSISADAQGYTGGATGAPGNGPGGGCGSALYDSAGGSYGGLGYSSPTCSAGPSYGSALTPTELGSGGGGTTTCAGGSCWDARVGGNGGGAIRLIVTGTLTNHGTISANGGNGGPNWSPSPDAYAVGGSGGSIWATVGTLTGSGAFTADGGLRYWGGQPVSGGGGGRVAVYYAVDGGFGGFDISRANGGPGAQQGTVAFKQYFILTVSRAGSGTGTVTSSPPGIDCGSACIASFDSGASVTLTATPAAGSSFTAWGGDSDCSDGEVTMTGNRTCTVTFREIIPPAISHTPVTSWSANRPILITATITDNIGVKEATLFYRSSGVSTYTSVAMVGSGPTFSATIPGSDSTTADVQYYLEARDASNNERRVPGTAPGTPYTVLVGTTVFTDDPLTAGSTAIKALHFSQLQIAINTLRARYGLTAFAWSATAPASGGMVRGTHLSDLRNALTQTYQKAGKADPSYTDPAPTAGQTVIKASHLSELRGYVRGLE